MRHQFIYRLFIFPTALEMFPNTHKYQMIFPQVKYRNGN